MRYRDPGLPDEVGDEIKICPCVELDALFIVTVGLDKLLNEYEPVPVAVIPLENVGVPVKEGLPIKLGFAVKEGVPENRGLPRKVGLPEKFGFELKSGIPVKEGFELNDGEPENTQFPVKLFTPPIV